MAYTTNGKYTYIDINGKRYYVHTRDYQSSDYSYYLLPKIKKIYSFDTVRILQMDKDIYPRIITPSAIGYLLPLDILKYEDKLSKQIEWNSFKWNSIKRAKGYWGEHQMAIYLNAEMITDDKLQKAGIDLDDLIYTYQIKVDTRGEDKIFYEVAETKCYY